MENSKNTIGIIPENSGNSGYNAKTMRKFSNVNSLMLLIFTILMIVGAVIGATVAENFVGEDSEYYKCIGLIVSMVIQYCVGVPLAILVGRKTKTGRNMETVRSLFRKPQQSVGWVVRWVFIGIFLSYGATLVTSTIFSIIEAITGVKLNQTDFSAENNSLSQVINIICITFMAPLFEECLIRGGMLNNIKRYGSWSAVISTGIFFGLLHMNYPQVPFACVMGIVSAFIVLKTNSIIPSIIIHFVINSIGGIMSLFTGNIDVEEMDSANIEVIAENIVPYLTIMFCGFLVFGFMITGLVFFITEISSHRDSFKLEKVNPEVSEGKKLCHYFTAPLTIILTLFYIGMTILNAIPQ